ncbi:hypothetical protein B0H12DRAFT_356493 [Mycena haematopus]|nr:hypothetical protein B0H12DRAFT_356493 [Mycena haematopus]
MDYKRLYLFSEPRDPHQSSHAESPGYGSYKQSYMIPCRSTNALGIADFPQDVLLELVKHLNVSDLISFLSICRAIRELQLERTLWINALTRLKQVEMQSPPLLSASSLDTMSLAQLQNTVQRANQLMNNFKSSQPRPARIHSVSVHPHSRIICIAGANLVVTHTTGGVSCWDIVTSRRVGYLEIPDLHLQTSVPCLEIKGKALIGASIGGSVRHLVAIWIDFRDRARISISHTISQATNLVYFDRTHFFVDAQVLGFCTTSHIVFWGLSPSGKVEITPQNNCCPVRLFIVVFLNV